MPFDSNGVFTRVMNWTSDQQNGIAIECGRHDQEDDNFAEGFNDTFCRDGRAAATGDFNLGSHKIKNLANGTVSTDAVNKGQLDTGLSAKANDNAVVKLTGNQTIGGTKTFSSSPLVPTASSSDNSTKAASTAFVKAQNYLHEDSKNSGNFYGDIKLSSDLKIQWGYASRNTTVTFDQPFTEKPGVICSPDWDQNSYAAMPQLVTTTSFYATCNSTVNGILWFAIGY